MNFYYHKAYIGLMFNSLERLNGLEILPRELEFEKFALPFECFQKDDCKDNWNEKYIVMLPDYECDSKDEKVRKESENAFKADLIAAQDLINQGQILIRLTSGNNTNLANIVRRYRKCDILVQVPLNVPLRCAEDHQKNLQKKQTNIDENVDCWEWWNAFRWINEFQSHVKVVLELNPSDKPTMNNLDRWLSEPVEFVIVPTSIIHDIFHDESSKWIGVFEILVRYKQNIIVAPPPSDDKTMHDYSLLFSKLRRYLFAPEPIVGLLVPVPLEETNHPYKDYGKHIKRCMLYERAIMAALQARIPWSLVNTTTAVIMILGGSEGSLIDCAVKASIGVQRNVKIYVLEKNMVAIRSLRRIISSKWPNEPIHLITDDIRVFRPSDKADIFVSDLLGGFGDNECLPEYLQCADHLLKPDAICIPCCTTSFIYPVMAAKVFPEHRGLSQGPMESGTENMDLHRFAIAKPRPLFTFIYPDRKHLKDNRHYNIIRFETKFNGVLTAISGYFKAVLYKNIHFRTRSITRTKDMISWREIYFTFDRPIDIKCGDIIEIHFWRRSSSTRIWYEWACELPQKTQIYNINGRTSSIYLKY